MASSKVLVIAAVLCAVALTVQAGGSGPLKLTGRKTIQTFGNDKTAKLGDTAVLTFSYSEGAYLYQSGIYVDLSTPAKLVNYQATLVLPKKIGKWPAGSIFIVGDGTGVQDPASLDKTVVGGTGPYANARGSYTVKNGVTTIKLFK